MIERYSLWIVGNSSTLASSQDWCALIEDANKRGRLLLRHQHNIVVDGINTLSVHNINTDLPIGKIAVSNTVKHVEKYVTSPVNKPPLFESAPWDVVISNVAVSY